MRIGSAHTHASVEDTLHGIHRNHPGHRWLRDALRNAEKEKNYKFPESSLEAAVQK
jgi:hypothetical protein